ncbi:HNH endonuclease [Xanthomonas campestris]|uniref:HNH endonuclease n=1 Tax=Xanthomonas campestris TaxID=339 RepID=UPI001D14A840|nr:HNH endonuclease [Xanthomonas campestris]MCC3254485.1 HNH endonuclease [Xanthomonas campestris pv. armoraciae]
MRRVREPRYNVSEILDVCLRHTEDNNLVERANTALNLLTAAELEYRTKANRRELYKVIESPTVGSLLSKDDMHFLYKKLSSSTPETRILYDYIKGLARGMICPLCNQRTVSTLDHYLAKSFHGSLAITPINLVPACKDCNTDSGTRRATSPGDQTFHPYFDNGDSEVWLIAEIVPESPPAAVFSTSKPLSWDEDFYLSAKSHFDDFNLSLLYSAQAGQELVNIYIDIINSPDGERPRELRQHFLETASRRRVPVRNSWQAAFYQAAADSEWLCNGGYLEIAHSELFQI